MSEFGRNSLVRNLSPLAVALALAGCGGGKNEGAPTPHGDVVTMNGARITYHRPDADAKYPSWETLETCDIDGTLVRTDFNWASRADPNGKGRVYLVTPHIRKVPNSPDC